MMKNLIPAILGPMLVAYGPVDVHPVRGTQRELVLAVAASRSEIVPEVWRDVVLDRLVDRVRTVMVTWEPAPKQLATSDLAEVARDIAEAALDRGSSNASDDAAVLMALSYWEGARWAAYVDDGRCNDRASRPCAAGATATAAGRIRSGRSTPWMIPARRWVYRARLGSSTDRVLVRRAARLPSQRRA